jgi:hypothetical protein
MQSEQAPSNLWNPSWEAVTNKQPQFHQKMANLLFSKSDEQLRATTSAGQSDDAAHSAKSLFDGSQPSQIIHITPQTLGVKRKPLILLTPVSTKPNLGVVPEKTAAKASKKTPSPPKMKSKKSKTEKARTKPAKPKSKDKDSDKSEPSRQTPKDTASSTKIQLAESDVAQQITKLTSSVNQMLEHTSQIPTILKSVQQLQTMLLTENV